MNRDRARSLALAADSPEAAKRLLDRVFAIDSPEHGVLYTTASTLTRRGFIDAVIERTWELSCWLAIGSAHAADAWTPHVRAALGTALLQSLPAEDTPEEPDFAGLHVVTCKHFIHHLEPDHQRALLDWLDTRIPREDARGDYDELDYPYGQIHPFVELALCHARCGHPDAASRWLERRTPLGALFHIEELLDLVDILAALGPGDAHTHWWPIFRGWARDLDESGYGHEGERMELEWLARAEPPTELDVEADVRAFIAASPGPQALDTLVQERPAWLRDGVLEAASQRLVEHLQEAVEGVSSEDSALRAKSIRAVAAAAITLESAHDSLTDAQHHDISEAASAWSRWFVGYDPHGDWLSHVYAAIALCTHHRVEIDAAIQRMRRELGDAALRGYLNGERLTHTSVSTEKKRSGS